jgi:hypothetical protein
MIYSRFNDGLGLYEVFEDGTTHALNDDFPVPRLGPDAGRVGVPATEAGRELPAAARRVGTSWHAKGLVVRPRGAGAGLGEMTRAELGKYVVPVAIIVTGLLVAFYIGPRLVEDEP